MKCVRYISLVLVAVGVILGLGALGRCSLGGSVARAASADSTITVAVATDPAAILDPRVTSNTPTDSLFVDLYDGLVEKNWYYPSKPFKIIPGLATSWKVSSNRKTYTFHLRHRVKFDDGTPFNAAAVVFNFDTVLDKRFKYYYPVAAAAAARTLQSIKSVTATGPYTVQIHLKYPFAPLLDTLSSPAQNWMISPTGIKKYGNKGMSTHDDGTGPFSVSSYVPGQSVTLQRNNDYWRGPAGVNQVVLKIIADPEARAAALEAGEVQIAEDLDTQLKQAWNGRSDIKLEVSPRARTYACFLNYNESGPETHFNFRKALSLSLNRQSMNEAVYQNLATIAHGYYAKGSQAYDPTSPPLATNIAEAKSLIKQGGWTGTTITMEVAPGLGEPALWQIMQQDVKAIGVNLQIATVSLPTWLGDFTAKLKPSLGMICATAGEDDFWSLAYYGSKAGFVANGGFNPGSYTNPQVERVLEQARNAPNEQDYIHDMRKADSLVTNNFGLIYLLNDVNAEGVRSNVSWIPSLSQQHSYYSARLK